MSWIEKGKVISTATNLIVRIKFGRLITFTDKHNYEKGDDISLIFTKQGDINILECRHSATSNAPPKPPKIKNIDYASLEYLEDLE